MRIKSFLKKLLLPDPNGIPVLVYHKVWPGVTDDLTLTPTQLLEQWQYLQELGYKPLSLPDFCAIIAGKEPCPPKSLLLTFDDGYKNNLTYAYPLLKAMGWCATVFTVGGTLDGTFSSKENTPMHQLMDAEDLRQLDGRVIQVALHGYHHENFSYYPAAEINRLLTKCIALLEENEIFFHKVIAFPYGRSPNSDMHLKKLEACFAEQGILCAFKTGNAVCRLPVKDKYLLPRIDVRGTDTIDDILQKLRYGSA